MVAANQKRPQIIEGSIVGALALGNDLFLTLVFFRNLLLLLVGRLVERFNRFVYN